jgi:hypothetical protein
VGSTALDIVRTILLTSGCGGGGDTQRPAYRQWAERLLRGRGGQATQITSWGSGKESKLEATEEKRVKRESEAVWSGERIRGYRGKERRG